MELIIKRLLDDSRSTVGKLYLDGRLFAGTLEDTRRHKKVPRLTRIPAGRYEIKLRFDSPMAKRYEELYGTRGMLWLQDVEDFEWVYIHIGNDDDDSDGCILVGWVIHISCLAGNQRGRLINRVL